MRRYLFFIILLGLFLFPLWMYIAWILTPKKELSVLILDKTVLNSKTQEHISLNWVLTNRKYVKDNRKLYNRHEDYYGFFPKKGFEYEIHDFNDFNEFQLDSLADNYDMLYYTDLYGIYTIEWYEENKRANPSFFLDQEKISALERSRKIYGGMTWTELDLLKRMKYRKKLIITEFNAIGSPTPRNIRRGFEDEFDMRWSGWIGRYFETLDTNKNKEIPQWLKRNYLEQHDSIWPFTKSGIAFVRWDDRVEILENQTHLNIDVPIIHTPATYMNKYKIPSTMKYPFWFDIIDYHGQNQVVSEYVIEPNSEGARLLRMWGIPSRFPAVLEYDKPNEYLFYYFAGDFCDNPVTMGTAKFRGVHWLSNFLYIKNTAERDSFFWNYYRPMLKRILNTYYSSLKE
jgi:hypothetical protein